LKTLQIRTRLVLDAIEQLIGDGASEVRPGDVAALLREKGQPLGAWEVRYEFSNLEQEGLMTSDPDSGAWHPADGQGRKAG
jgi:repressor of nif and glnA expression